MLTNIKIARFNTHLRAFDGLAHEAVGQLFAFFPAHFAHHIFQAITAKDTHQVIFGGEIEFRAPRVTLSARTAAKLIVNSA